MNAKRTDPSKSLLHSSFKYVPAAQTDIGARFKAMRLAQTRAEKKQVKAQAAAAQQSLELECSSVVQLLTRDARAAA